VKKRRKKKEKKVEEIHLVVHCGVGMFLPGATCKDACEEESLPVADAENLHTPKSKAEEVTKAGQRLLTGEIAYAESQKDNN
jgi:hypothetical protein